MEPCVDMSNLKTFYMSSLVFVFLCCWDSFFPIFVLHELLLNFPQALISRNICL